MIIFFLSEINKSINMVTVHRIDYVSYCLQIYNPGSKLKS